MCVTILWIGMCSVPHHVMARALLQMVRALPHVPPPIRMFYIIFALKLIRLLCVEQSKSEYFILFVYVYLDRHEHDES